SAGAAAMNAASPSVHPAVVPAYQPRPWPNPVSAIPTPIAPAATAHTAALLRRLSTGCSSGASNTTAAGLAAQIRPYPSGVIPAGAKATGNVTIDWAYTVITSRLVAVKPSRRPSARARRHF